MYLCEWCIAHRVVDDAVAFCPMCETWFCKICFQRHLDINQCNKEQVDFAVSYWISLLERNEVDGETGSER